ncbi:hypothetical protein JTE90_024542 [Oedothorax gibbosus]|uniref:Uncharacterized protein n=1 Tax=Oedothorax gibbosus TaxID=931172 RepID=A0AAV6VE83_9ARAC|nr:hypothetical protein JTE90_024542 [Oedothorax gibbosus]
MIRCYTTLIPSLHSCNGSVVITEPKTNTQSQRPSRVFAPKRRYESTMEVVVDIWRGRYTLKYFFHSHSRKMNPSYSDEVLDFVRFAERSVLLSTNGYFHMTSFHRHCDMEDCHVYHTEEMEHINSE